MHGLEEMERRIGVLERRQKHWKQAGLLLGAAALTAIGLGQSRPAEQVIRASRFAVVDAEGKERAWLALEDGSPTLVLTNSQGKAVLRCDVPAIPDKAAFYLIDPVERSGMELAMTMNGPVIHLTDASGVRARLATNELNAPLVAVYDEKGRLKFDVTSKAKP